MALEDLAVLTISPDWSENVTETLEWLTAILASPIGAEQRFAVRSSPRRSFEMTFKPHGVQRTLFDLFIQRAGGSDIYLPVWQEAHRLTVDASSSLSALTVDSLAYTEFKNCPAVYVQGSDVFDYSIYEYAGESGNTITTGTILGRNWPKGTRIFPAVKCRIEQQPQAARKADGAYQVRVKFSSVLPNYTDEAIVLTTFNDQMVLEREPNDIQDLTYEYQRLLAELDNQSGLRRRKDLNGWGITVQQFTFTLKGRQDHAWLRALFYRLQGRKYPIFVPTFFRDLEPVADLDTTAMVVKRCGYTDFAGPFRGRQIILIHLRDGTRLYRQIMSSVLIGGGETEQLTLDAGFSPVVPIGAIHRVSFLAVARLSSDSLEIVHHTDTMGAATCTTNFQTIPAVRTPLPDPPDNEDDNETGWIQGVDPALLYFEVEFVSGTNSHAPQIGIAGNGFQLENPWSVDVSGSGSTCANGIFWGVCVGGGTPGQARGYPFSNVGFGGAVPVEGDILGIAVNLTTKSVWISNVTQDPDTWYGSTAGCTTADVIASTNGVTFDASGASPISGNIYILGGSGWENFGPALPLGSLTLNSGGPFLRDLSALTGFTAWGDTHWNTGDSSVHLVFSNGDKTLITDQAGPGSNQPTFFCRSVSSKVVP